MIVTLNFAEEAASINLHEVNDATILLSTYMDHQSGATGARLRPGEGVIFRVA
jgi:hypothetical protein